ncbi:MAG: hypothetical protein PHQ23_07710 [Candidatus Wallbacteria bacterium]|nr:hypothetical protein [Candidatus Wallbacteria bacterium]
MISAERIPGKIPAQQLSGRCNPILPNSTLDLTERTSRTDPKIPGKSIKTGPAPASAEIFGCPSANDADRAPGERCCQVISESQSEENNSANPYPGENEQ